MQRAPWKQEVVGKTSKCETVSALTSGNRATGQHGKHGGATGEKRRGAPGLGLGGVLVDSGKVAQGGVITLDTRSG